MADGEEVERASITLVGPAEEATKSENVGDGDTKPDDKPISVDETGNDFIRDAEGATPATTVTETETSVEEQVHEPVITEEGEHSIEEPTAVGAEFTAIEDEKLTQETSAVDGEFSVQEPSTVDGGEHLLTESIVTPTTLDQVSSIPEELAVSSIVTEEIAEDEKNDVICIPPDRYPYLPIEEHDYSWAQMEEVKMTDLSELGKRKLTPIFLALMCKKNKDKTQHLVLRGSHLMKNLKRRLCDDDLVNIGEYLKDNKLVISLDLAYNNITSDGLKRHLLPLLQENRVLKELILSNNEICLQGLEAISEISSELSLTSLRLNGNKLGPKSGEALARLLADSKTLVHLDISETDQNVSSLACVAAILRNDYACGSVNRYPFFRRAEKEDEQKKEARICSPSQLALYMRHLVNQQNGEEDNGSLLSLSSSEKNRINCPDQIDWTLPLKKMKLKKYDSQPALKHYSDLPVKRSEETLVEDMKCVCEPLSEQEVSSVYSQDEITKKPILEILFLDKILGHYHYQPLTYHFTRILSDMIKANDSLRELHLQKNSLTDSDIHVLCQGLRENSTIRLLDLSANHIGCLGLSYIAECLSNIKLEALILNHNDISDHGARSLFFTLPSTNLKMLDLAHNSISDAGMMDLLYTMRKQPKILALFIWGNPITHVSLKKVKEYLVQGWILTDSLDIQIYEVDDILCHAWRPSADPYKDSYYLRPSRHMSWPPPPPQSHGRPTDFKHYDFLYSRTMSKYIPKTFLYPPGESNSCTT